MDWSFVCWHVYVPEGLTMLTLSLLQTVTPEPITQGFVQQLFEQYGVMGLVFGLLLVLIMRQNKASQKRIEDLEKLQQAQHTMHIESQKQTIVDYVELVRSKTTVLGDLTSCLNAIKDTLERMERRQEK